MAIEPTRSAGRTERAAEWIYTGVWSVLTQLFRVPNRHEPPILPVQEGGTVESMRPADGYLRMQKFIFWVFLFWPMDVLILVLWIVLMVTLPILGLILLIPALAVAILPDLIVYIAIHLRYDTMWYVLSDRAMRLRRGVWILHEVTISFENVQNVTVRQGPVQRYFGIADVVIETAGASGHPKQGGTMVSNRGVIEGVADAPRIRDLILARLKQSKTAGLGDEEHHAVQDDGHAPASRAMHGEAGGGFTAEHVDALREIRDELRMLNAA